MSTNEQGDGNKKLYCILAYIFILWLVGLIQMKEDPDVKFHVNQGIVLSIAGVALGVIAAIPVLGWILAPIGSIVLLVFAIMGIVAANNGEQKELPLIGKIKILK
ncbi:MAG: DUF4870 domain-containing protein [Clostridiales bacterium]|nr:DUF4870 domain-containing protein [Clostridiales bacterium]